jgi:putative transcriptional regulator
MVFADFFCTIWQTQPFAQYICLYNRLKSVKTFSIHLNMELKSDKPAQGKILISEPFLKDYYFKRSVVLLADHSDEGTFGLILNKPIDTKFNEIVTDFPDFKADIYLGGPVKTDSLFFIHSLGEGIENTIKIMDGIYWGGNIDRVREMIIDQKITPKQIRFYLGYSGWGPHQLENELEEKSWVVADVKASLLLKNPPEKMWKNIVSKLGSDYSQWVNYPADPILN